ncbi:GNAT family N-acetyltransferase [Dyadobacter sp. NIV53]|uniref:GNAT family N-acetyltransferase n=1 Tax=Dyadobacter sp. NIV53 TaxID=2861765 RepID=UPI001C8745DB|nr:GNAT family N-acetyltransferase [Dyadobacter sp. NIV53]
MRTFTIQTARFILTKMIDGDQDKYYSLCRNENVMKFVTGHALSREESDKMFREFLIENKSDNYFGRYFIEERFTGELIGAVKLDKIWNEIEIGYRIMEEYWGRGIATAIAKDLISFARDTLNAKRVIAFVNVENAASIRVLEKAGMDNIATINDFTEVKYKFSYSTQKSTVVKKLVDATVELVEGSLKNLKEILEK